jgi:hypothetical protein
MASGYVEYVDKRDGVTTMETITQKHPLILSPHWDLHAASVCWGLGKNGISPIWSASLAEDAIGPISLYGDCHKKWRIEGGINGSRLSTVWFRRPRKPKTFPHTRACDASCLRREWSEFHDNVYALGDELGDILWINSPTSALRAENKLVQLQAARQCGLHFPETLVSNNPAEIRRFINKHDRAIYKSFVQYVWKESCSGRMFVPWVRVIDSGFQIDDASIALCPGIYQPCIEKKYDLRVTVIGNRLFTMRIRSIKDNTLVDWRQQALTNKVQADVFMLPSTYECKLRLLMQKLDIVFGCIDLVVDANGKAYFLEVNQGGEFLFVEKLVKSLPVFRAMCAMLATGRIDYSLEAVTNISYQDYLESDSFYKWKNEVNDDHIRQGTVIIE